MPNIKSAKKRVLIAEVRRERNMAVKTKMKTQLKKFATAVEAGDKEAAAKELQASVSVLDKTAGKGIIHRNAAARHKSNLYKAYQHME